MSVVAVSETIGSLGNEIGRRVAQARGYEFSDREIIAKAAERRLARRRAERRDAAPHP
jgi:hypothetical protein